MRVDARSFSAEEDRHAIEWREFVVFKQANSKPPLENNDSEMEKPTQSDSKLTFLESIPSQLRYAYVAMMKRKAEKPPKLRDRDKDLNDVMEGHSFGYIPFEKICKNNLDPEDCFLQFDAVSCKLILNMTSSMVIQMSEHPAFVLLPIALANSPLTHHMTPCAGVTGVSPF
jgi:hypothetical protein